MFYLGTHRISPSLPSHTSECGVSHSTSVAGAAVEEEGREAGGGERMLSLLS